MGLIERPKLHLTLFSLAIIVALYVGWNIRNEYVFSAEHGIGYGLGIVGGSMMLLLLLYPLRKRFYHSSFLIFSTKNWFKIHMALGILGPLLILYHCNFSFGSTNSNVALVCMLLMVTSGLIGRFIYSKIHHGLYGEKIQLKELLNQQILLQQELDLDQANKLVCLSDIDLQKLQQYETVLTQRSNLFASFLSVASVGINTRLDKIRLSRKLHAEQRKNDTFNSLDGNQQQAHFSALKRHISMYLYTVRKIAGLKFYEKLFSLWHMLHLPIFFMLVITGFVHVYAVHVY